MTASIIETLADYDTKTLRRWLLSEEVKRDLGKDSPKWYRDALRDEIQRREGVSA